MRTATARSSMLLMAAKKSLARLDRARAAFLLAFALLAAGGAGADDQPLTPVPNRPTASTTAESVAAGVFEVEGGIEAARDHQNLGGLLKLGALDQLELWLGGVPFQRAETGCLGPPMPGASCTIEHESGVGDAIAGFKLRLLRQKGDVPSISVLYLAKLPTASAGRGLGSGKVDHAATLLVSKDFGKIHLDFNEGIELLGRPESDGFDHDFFTALAASCPVSARWGVSGEVSGFSSAVDGDSGTVSVLGAATYSPSPRLVLDAAVSVGVHGDQPRITVLAGATYTVGRAFRR
jgi:Putative MetA-pathway of phenol degradation